MMGTRFRNRAGVLLAIALVIGLSSMASIAPLWTGWAQQQGPKYAPPGAYPSSQSGSLPAGVPFLPDELGGARLVVEIAFGANVADTTEASWTWYDVSSDVHYDPGIHISPIGRTSESQSAPPAECTFELDNTSNKYSPFNPLATYWPNVKEGTPIRVRVIISGVSYTRFQGRAIGFNPTPDSTGYHQMITVTAAGVTRVIGQQSAPVKSPMARGIATGSTPPPVWYVPGEDGADATAATSGLPGGSGMVVTAGSPAFASVSGFPGSGPQIGMSGATLQGVIPDGFGSSGSFVNQWRYEMAIRYPSKLTVTSNTIAYLDLAGSSSGLSQFQLLANDPGDQGLQLFYIQSGAETGFASGAAVDDGNWHFIQFDAVQSGGNVVLILWLDSNVVLTQTITGATLTRIARVTINPTADATYAPDAGQFVVRDQASSNSWAYTSGYSGETPDARLSRVMSENGYAFNTIGFYDTRATMGAQEYASLDTIARSCEATEAGWLYDGLTGGTSFMAPSQRYDQFSQFTLDGSKGEVMPDLWPVQDDFARANQVTMTNVNGSSFTYSDDTGPNGTAAVGIYAGNAPTQVNYADSSQLSGRARWEVHKGTAFGFRWPTINVNVRKIADRAAKIAGMTPGLRFTIYPMPVRYQAQYGTDPVELIAEGWSEFLTQVNWEIAYNCSSQDIYDVVKVGDSQFGRLGTSGHTLASDAVTGVTTIRLATPADTPLWTTYATNPGDFPLTIMIDGIKLSVPYIGQRTPLMVEGFEGGVSAWTGSAGWSVASSTAFAYEGSQSLMMTPPGAVSDGGTFGPSKSVTAGNSYTVLARVYSVAGWSDCYLSIDWYNGSSVFLSNSASGTFVAGAGTWTGLNLTATAPATAAFAVVNVNQGSTPSAADVMWVDQVILTQTDTPGSDISPQRAVVNPVPRFIQAGQSASMWKNGVVKL